MKKGEILRGPPASMADVLALDDVEAADAGADVDAEAVAVVSSMTLRPECSMASCDGGEGEVDEAAHLAGLFLLDEQQRVEVLDLGGEANGVAGEIEGLDLGHAAFAGQQAFPDLGCGLADAADEADAGDDDRRRLLAPSRLASLLLCPFWFFSM